MYKDFPLFKTAKKRTIPHETIKRTAKKVNVTAVVII